MNTKATRRAFGFFLPAKSYVHMLSKRCRGLGCGQFLAFIIKRILGIKCIFPCSFGNKRMCLLTRVYGMSINRYYILWPLLNPGRDRTRVGRPVPSRLLKSGTDMHMRDFFFLHDTVLALNVEDTLMTKKSLRSSDVQILENADKYDYISAPPSKPKVSQVFLYKTDDAAKEGSILHV